jgi:hypothetical protein
MVEPHEEYRWPGDHYNASYESDGLIIPPEIYQRLGSNEDARVGAYKDLFTHDIAKKENTRIFDATNKCWAIGKSGFLTNILRTTNSPLVPILGSGDRRSTDFNRVLPFRLLSLRLVLTLPPSPTAHPTVW